MAFTFGFYNALDHDRRYNAIQMGEIFDGLIEDGVFETIGEIFATVAGTGMQVMVKTGKAWFNHTWNKLDAWLPLFIDQSDIILPRYDTIVLEVDERDENRINAIKVVKGVPSLNATKPLLLNTDLIHQYPLAHIYIEAAAEEITNENIEIVVGTSECPFVTGPLETVPIEDLWNRWEAEFETWFNNLKAQLTDNVVTNLQNQIDELNDTIENVANSIVEEPALTNFNLFSSKEIFNMLSDYNLHWWGVASSSISYISKSTTLGRTTFAIPENSGITVTLGTSYTFDTSNGVYALSGVVSSYAFYNGDTQIINAGLEELSGKYMLVSNGVLYCPPGTENYVSNKYVSEAPILYTAELISNSSGMSFLTSRDKDAYYSSGRFTSQGSNEWNYFGQPFSNLFRPVCWEMRYGRFNSNGVATAQFSRQPFLVSFSYKSQNTSSTQVFGFACPTSGFGICFYGGAFKFITASWNFSNNTLTLTDADQFYKNASALFTALL